MNAQGGAYAIGVLVLITSAAVAVTLAARSAGQRTLMAAFGLITLVFVYTTIDNIRERSDGVKIASVFITAIVAISLYSRVSRSLELRVTEVEFDDTAKTFLADCARRSIRLVANEPDARDRAEYRDKLVQIQRDNDLATERDVIFVEVTVTDPSDFETRLNVHGEVCTTSTGCSPWSPPRWPTPSPRLRSRRVTRLASYPICISSGPRATRSRTSFASCSSESVRSLRSLARSYVGRSGTGHAGHTSTWGRAWTTRREAGVDIDGPGGG